MTVGFAKTPFQPSYLKARGWDDGWFHENQPFSYMRVGTRLVFCRFLVQTNRLELGWLIVGQVRAGVSATCCCIVSGWDVSAICHQMRTYMDAFLPVRRAGTNGTLVYLGINNALNLKPFDFFVSDQPSPRFHQQRGPTYFLRTYVWLPFSCIKSD